MWVLAYPPQRKFSPSKKWRWLDLVLPASLTLWVPFYQLLFLAACQLCVCLANEFAITLYDFYILAFGIGIPLLLLAATVATLAKLYHLLAVNAFRIRPAI